jgi:hypothetical protein
MGRNLAGTALGCGIAGLPLGLLSYAWLPFAVLGREGELVRYAVAPGPWIGIGLLRSRWLP